MLTKHQVFHIVGLIGMLTLAACSLFRTEAENELEYVREFCMGESLAGSIQGIKAKAALQRQKLDSVEVSLGLEKYRQLSQKLDTYSDKAEILNQQIQAACRPFASCKYRTSGTQNSCQNEQENWDDNQRAIRELIKDLETIEGEIKKAEAKKGPVSSTTQVTGPVAANAQGGFAIINTGPGIFNLINIQDISDAAQIDKALKNETVGGKQSEYLKSKLAFIARQFEDIKKDQLIVRSTASIFAELMRLAETAHDSICSINHRPEVWRSINNPMSFVYEDYLQENAKSSEKKGVRISRVWVLDKHKQLEPDIRELAQTQLSANVSLYIVDRDEMKHVNAYTEMAKAYSGLPSAVEFYDLNVASYDHQIVVYTLAYGNDKLKLPTQLRVTWQKEEVERLDPCTVVQALRQMGKLPYGSPNS